MATPLAARRRPLNLILAVLLAAIQAGCHHAPVGCTECCVGRGVEYRMGHQLCQTSGARCEAFLPPGVSLDDGLTVDEAIAVALCNNAAFQDLLVELRLANADLIQAGLLPNPEVAYFFSVSDKPYKYLVDFPVESLWLRPLREDAALEEVARVRDRLVQAALDLIREVRWAYADLLLAESRQRIGDEAIELRGEVAAIGETRLQAGDIAPQETSAARIDALQARQDALRLAFDAELARERLRNVLGMPEIRAPFRLEPITDKTSPVFSAETLVAEALASRPDMQAATQAVDAAESRLRVAKVGWFRLLGIADATSGRQTGHEFGPGLRATLPIFHWNEGAIARAEAEVERAARQRRTLHDTICLEVRRAYLQHEQSRVTLEHVRKVIRPEVDAAIKQTQIAYREGNTTYVVVLEATRQLLDSYLREAQLQTDHWRATAELERAVGRRLVAIAPATELESPPHPEVVAPGTTLPSEIERLP